MVYTNLPVLCQGMRVEGFSNPHPLILRGENKSFMLNNGPTSGAIPIYASLKLTHPYTIRIYEAASDRGYSSWYLLDLHG